MSSLPLISHRMFVSALAPERGQKEKPKTERCASGLATAIPLELLDCFEAAGEAVARPLQVAPSPSGF